MSDLANDPRLQRLAGATEPAWLWRLDPPVLVWRNAAAETLPQPGTAETRQIAAMAEGFAAPAARMATLADWFGQTKLNCACSRLALVDGGAGLLVLALEPVTPLILPRTPDAAAHTPEESPENISTEATQSAALPSDQASPPRATEWTEAAPPAVERRHALRFVWQTDEQSHFTLDSAEFIRLAGPSTAAQSGKPWAALAAALGLDAEGRIAQHLASRDTWSGIALQWPVDGDAAPLAVELSGLPVFDRDRIFRGYRGFGICRDTTRLNDIAIRRAAEREDAVEPAPKPAHAAQETTTPARATPQAEAVLSPEDEPNLHTVRAALAGADSPDAPDATPIASGERDGGLMPTLSAVERNAFRELARQLTARLKPATPESEKDEAPPATPAASPRAEITRYASAAAPVFGQAQNKPASAGDDPAVLDRLPVGFLIHRGERIIFANATFLKLTGYDSTAELVSAGGLAVLFREQSQSGPAARGPQQIVGADGRVLALDSRLFSLTWDGESALALMLTKPAVNERSLAAEVSELKAALDTATDGVVMLDSHGLILSVNRAAESLFGQDQEHLAGERFAELFVEESQRVARDYFDSLASVGVTSLLNDGREVIGRVNRTGTIPLFMTMGRVSEDGERYCAVFRDISQWKKAEAELVGARRNAELASSAKSDFLAKISHEIRTPLNAIIGFSEVMMEERFGAIGNERYRGYVADIHASGQHVLSLINDLLDLSKIEAGKLDLQFDKVNLNDIVDQCVALMQPQANRQRIIIRTSLSQALPPVVADARSVRQIALNLLSNSVKFTEAGGQVIVSTALLDNGEAVLRVRDTGIGMSESDIAAAMQPFRQLAVPGRWDKTGTGLGLPLTKALTEANRARFDIKSAANNGTLVEITFPATRVLAE